MSAQTEGFEQRYAGELESTLVCLDRVIIYGTLTGLSQGRAVAGELTRAGLSLFDIPLLAKPLQKDIRERAAALAAEHGAAVEFLRNWRIDKEDRAKEYLRQRGDRPGLVCI